jgi:hypothetical protein
MPVKFVSRGVTESGAEHGAICAVLVRSQTVRGADFGNKTSEIAHLFALLLQHFSFLWQIPLLTWPPFLYPVRTGSSAIRPNIPLNLSYADADVLPRSPARTPILPTIHPQSPDPQQRASTGL